MNRATAGKHLSNAADALDFITREGLVKVNDPSKLAGVQSDLRRLSAMLLLLAPVVDAYADYEQPEDQPETADTSDEHDYDHETMPVWTHNGEER